MDEARSMQESLMMSKERIDLARMGHPDGRKDGEIALGEHLERHERVV
jgi:hypothetical protein